MKARRKAQRTPMSEIELEIVSSSIGLDTKSKTSEVNEFVGEQSWMHCKHVGACNSRACNDPVPISSMQKCHVHHPAHAPYGSARLTTSIGGIYE